MDFLLRNPNAAMITPALSLNSTTTWNHLKTHNKSKPERVWMIDNLAALYRAEWFDSVGRFDRAQTYAWGVDLELSFVARCQGRSIWRDDRVQIEKISQIGYTLNRMNMSKNQRGRHARTQMNARWSKSLDQGGKNTSTNFVWKELPIRLLTINCVIVAMASDRPLFCDAARVPDAKLFSVPLNNDIRAVFVSCRFDEAFLSGTPILVFWVAILGDFCSSFMSIRDDLELLVNILCS